MRLGKVLITHSYVVDLDNQDQVDHAKDALLEDILEAGRYGELHLLIKVQEDPTAQEGDIATFLIEEESEAEL